MLPYQFHEEARIELSATLAYHDELDHSLETRLYFEIQKAITEIRRNPEIFSLRNDHPRINLKTFPFYLPFVVREDVVIIIAIAHNSRRPGYWRDRL